MVLPHVLQGRQAASMRIGYLLSEYPTPGHAFMEREMARLERLGVEVHVAAIRRPPRANTRAAAPASDGARPTYYVRQAGALTALRAHLHALIQQPAGSVRGVAQALRIGGCHPRRTAAALGYLAEAVLVGDWMRARDLTHLHTHFSSTVALLAATVWPVTFSMTIHGPDEFDAQPPELLRAKVAAARFVVAISAFARSQIMRRSAPADWDKIDVVPLGVEAEALRRIEPVEAERTSPPGASPAFRIVCAGRLAPVKGHRVLIEALADLAARSPMPFVVHVAGDGPERGALERLVVERGLEGRVRFEGLLQPPALVALYRRADLFVLPTFAEGVPVVLMEAMALEIPCVSTWVSGVPELIETRRSGVLVPPGDAEALADAIDALMRDPDARRRLGREGRAVVAARYDIDRNARRLFEVFARRTEAASLRAAAEPVTAAPTATQAL